MTTQQEPDIYGRRGLRGALSFGVRPTVLVVDFQCGFTDPDCPLGSDCTAAVEATREVLDRARDMRLPIVYTAIAFDRSSLDGVRWIEKVPALAELRNPDRWIALDPRLGARPDELKFLKTGASAFFGTPLASVLVGQGVDTIVLCGATTSGCVRATAVDAIQHNFATLLPRECVADRASGPHDANLFDIDAKYADVVPLEEALSYLRWVDRHRAHETRSDKHREPRWQRHT